MYSEITKKLINSSIEKRNRKFEGKCDWLKIPPRLTCLFIQFAILTTYKVYDDLI